MAVVPATVAPPWPCSALCLSPGSLVGLAHGSLFASVLVFLALGLFIRNVCFGKPCFQAKQWELRDACFASAAPLRAQPGGWAGVPQAKRSNVSFVPPQLPFTPGHRQSWDSCPGFLRRGGDPGIPGFLNYSSKQHCFLYSLPHTTYKPLKVGVLFPFYRWSSELRPREGKSLFEGHTAAKQQSQDLNPYSLPPQPMSLPLCYNASRNVYNHSVKYGSH